MSSFLLTQLSQVSVESGYEVVRSFRFKVLRTIQNVNIKLVDERGERRDHPDWLP